MALLLVACSANELPCAAGGIPFAAELQAATGIAKSKASKRRVDVSIPYQRTVPAKNQAKHIRRRPQGRRVRASHTSGVKNGVVVESVNVGLPQEATWNRQTFTTAIVKRPVRGRVRLLGVNAEGDDQADRTVHGGVDKAIYGYGTLDYEWWHETHDVAPEPGLFGENLTLSGIDLSECLIGERWRFGSALLEVSEPRVPCYKLAYRMNDPHFVKLFSQALRPGSYFRIVEEGDVGAGDGGELQFRPDTHDVTVRECMRIYLFARGERQRLASVAALGEDWRKWAAEPPAT